MKRIDILGDSVEVRFENAFVVVYWNQAEHWVGTWWKQAKLGEDWGASDTVRQSLEGGLAIIREKKITRWLADSRDMGVMPPDVQKWTAEDWWPRALASGFRWLAILVPQSALAKMAIETTLPEEGEELPSETRFFSDADAAKAWLRSKA